MNARAGKESRYDLDLKRITVNEGLDGRFRRTI